MHARKTAGKRLRVFVSHNIRDVELAKQLVLDAASQGILAYVFEHDLQPGSVVADKIQTAIQGSHVVLALLTKDGADSAYVQQEVGAARQLGKPIIPIVEVGVNDKRLGMLAGVEYLPFDRDNLPELQRMLATSLAKRRDSFVQAQQQQAVAAVLVIVSLLAALSK